MFDQYIAEEPTDWEASTTDPVDAMLDAARQAAYHQFLTYKAIMGVVDAYLGDESWKGGLNSVDEAMDLAEAEIRAAFLLSSYAARCELELAWALRERLPQVAVVLGAGVLDRARAKVICDETADLSNSQANTIANTVLEEAARMTTAQIRNWIRKLRVDTNPTEASDRYQEATSDRKVVGTLMYDGTATISASGLAPDRALAVLDKLDGIANGFDDDRSKDQLRADALLDLLEGTSNPDRSASQRPLVDVRGNLTTFMNLDNQAIELSGFGPVIADIGRQIVGRGVAQRGSRWQFTITDDTGNALTTITRRRPIASDKRIIEAKDPYCIFPGCSIRSTKCDLDHRIMYSDGGATVPAHMAPLCRHCHVIRHKGWEHGPNIDGSHWWKSPLEKTYTTARAPDY